MVVKNQWKSAGLMGLIMIGIWVVWEFLQWLFFFVLLPLSIVTVIAGAVAGGIPALIVAGIGSLFMEGWLPWIAGAIAGAPLLFIVTFAPFLLVDGWVKVFRSSIWTLSYREMKALDSLEPDAASIEAAE